MPRKPKRYYAVAKGKKPGIYRTWPEAESQVSGFPGAIHKGFVELDQAQEWLSQQATIVHNSNGRYFRDQQGLSEEQVAYNELAEIRQIRAQHGREAARRIRGQMGIQDSSSPEAMSWPAEEPTPQTERTTTVGPTSTSVPTSKPHSATSPPDADLYTRRRLPYDDSDDDEDARNRRNTSPQRSRHERHNHGSRRSASPERNRSKRPRVP